jgi:hypothetical protein
MLSRCSLATSCIWVHDFRADNTDIMKLTCWSFVFNLRKRERESASECVCVHMHVGWGVVGVTAPFRSPIILSCLPASSSVQAKGQLQWNCWWDYSKFLSSLFDLGFIPFTNTWINSYSLSPSIKEHCTYTHTHTHTHTHTTTVFLSGCNTEFIITTHHTKVLNVWQIMYKWGGGSYPSSCHEGIYGEQRCRSTHS